MAALSIGIATTIPVVRTSPKPTHFKPSRISCIGWVPFCFHLLPSFDFDFDFSQIFNYSVFILRRKDPEGLFGPPKTGHIARREFQRRLEKDSEAREAFERQVLEEKARREALRQVIPELGFGCFDQFYCFLFHLGIAFIF